MRIGIIGLPGSGKSTMATAIARGVAGAKKGAAHVLTVRAPDPRVDFLSALYKPRKTTYAQVEYLVPGQTGKDNGGGQWSEVQGCDALIQVVKNFGMNGAGPEQALADVKKVGSDMVLSDFMVVQKRLERIEQEAKRGRRIGEDERDALGRAAEVLEKEVPLRDEPELAGSPLLRGYGLTSAKPLLIVFNNDDDDGELPPLDGLDPKNALAVRGKIESELAGMDDNEAHEFLSEFGIEESAMDRVIRRSYEVLGLISFFTVGEDEVKAWTVRQKTAAVDAADEIHSDIRKGFIRAEVVGCDDLEAAGDYQGAKKLGKVRLEGKSYEVKDGDIICFRFNV